MQIDLNKVRWLEDDRAMLTVTVNSILWGTKTISFHGKDNQWYSVDRGQRCDRSFDRRLQVIYNEQKVIRDGKGGRL